MGLNKTKYKIFRVNLNIRFIDS